ncbi:MAG: hypothetical protein VYA34_01695 [Myxococcota bacterium]|nr:hypothetical protein [Myxococcota bacterium]
MRNKILKNRVKDRHNLHLALYAMLVLSAGSSFFLSDVVWEAVSTWDLSVTKAILAPIAFVVFVFMYAIDRLVLVKMGRFPLIRALAQIGFAAVFLTALIQQEYSRYQEAREKQAVPSATIHLLKHREASVRGAACELLGYRDYSNLRLLKQLAKTDVSAQVRKRCEEASIRLDKSIEPRARIGTSKNQATETDTQHENLIDETPTPPKPVDSKITIGSEQTP